MVKKKEIGIYRKLKEVMEKGKNEVIEEDWGLREVLKDMKEKVEEREIWKGEWKEDENFEGEIIEGERERIKEVK